MSETAEGTGLKLDALVLANASQSEIRKAIDRACGNESVVLLYETAVSNPTGIILPWQRFMELAGPGSQAEML